MQSTNQKETGLIQYINRKLGWVKNWLVADPVRLSVSESANTEKDNDDDNIKVNKSQKLLTTSPPKKRVDET